MEVVFRKLFGFSGLLDNRNVLRSGKMEEKALEVYGEDVRCQFGLTTVQLISSRLLPRVQE